MDEDEMALSPAETLRLIERQEAETVRAFKGDPLLLYAPWGVAWLIGFGALFLAYGLDGVPYAPISQDAAATVLMGIQLFSGTAAAFGIFRAQGNSRGQLASKSRMYLTTWIAGMVLMTTIGLRFGPMLPSTESGLFWAASSLLVVGVLYMAGGAIWMESTMFRFGLWAVAVTAVGVVLGPGWHALLTAVLLGAGQIVLGVWLKVRG
ncbi:hypothetical protein ACIBG8_13275 [Nonomuraea sp. NPDC050556]|uniref:hypothetical protein n=1 Tax=Nonomuraea sp. NPDC050556 TaxID=3364369 RepID=UPI00378C5162